MTEYEEAELRAALRQALQLLGEVEAEANNMQLTIARFRRRHHKAIEAAVERR